MFEGRGLLSVRGRDWGLGFGGHGVDRGLRRSTGEELDMEGLEERWEQDSDSGIRAVGSYWDWGADGYSSDDEFDDSVETEEIAAMERKLTAMKDELA